MAFDGSPDMDFPVDSGRYIGIDDQIMVQAVSSAATQDITVRGRLCRKDGRLVPFTFTFTTDTAGMVLTKAFQLAEGFLESLQVSSPACATAGQWMYANVGLQRGTGAAAVPYETLFANYVGSVLSIGWPKARLQLPTDGPGVLRSMTVADPAAGTDWTLTVPAGRRWIIQSVFFQLVTSAVSAFRQVTLQITDGTHVLIQAPQDTSQSENVTGTYTFGPLYLNEIDPSSSVRRQCANIGPNLTVEGGYVISSIAENIDAADQYSAIALSVFEWAVMQ